MKNSEGRMTGLKVMVLAALAVGAVGCGGGDSKGKSKGTPPGQTHTNPNAGMITPARDAGNTAQVLQDAQNRENELQSPTGNGVGGNIAMPTGNGMAATVSGGAQLASSGTAGTTPLGGATSGGGAQLGTQGGSRSNNFGLGQNPSGSSGGSFSSTGSSGGIGSNGINGAGVDSASSGAGGPDSAGASGVGTGSGSQGDPSAAGVYGANGGRSGSGGGMAASARGMSDFYGSGSGGDQAGSNPATSQFGTATGDVNPLGSEDPQDYFTRLGMGDDLFKIVERRYQNKAVVWATNQMGAISAKARRAP